MRREFQREAYKLQMTDKKLNKDLKRMVDKKEPQVIVHLIQANKRNVAQNILKNQRFMDKYRKLDNQLQNTQFQ